MIFWSCKKTACLEKCDSCQNLWRHSLVNKQLQYIYWPIFQEVKTTRQWKYNLRNIFFLENHAQNVVEKLFPDSVLKNWNWAYLWINILKVLYIFIVCKVEDYWKWLKLSCRLLAFTSCKAFLENKKKLVYVSPEERD